MDPSCSTYICYPLFTFEFLWLYLNFMVPTCLPGKKKKYKVINMFCYFFSPCNSSINACNAADPNKSQTKFSYKKIKTE